MSFLSSLKSSFHFFDFFFFLLETFNRSHFNDLEQLANWKKSHSEINVTVRRRARQCMAVITNSSCIVAFIFMFSSLEIQISGDGLFESQVETLEFSTIIDYCSEKTVQWKYVHWESRASLRSLREEVSNDFS